MSRGRPVGVFTTDLALVVRSWDAWLAEATGVPEADAVDRPLATLFPDLEARGLLARLRRVAEQGAVEVLAPAFHGYLLACPPREPSAHFTRMQQHVTIAPLRAGDATVGTVVTIEDVTARRDRERELARQLADADESVRLHAVREIGAQDPALLPAAPLVGALGDASWRVRRAAADGLARARSDEAAQALIDAVRERHRDPAVLNAALVSLRDSERDVVPPLVELLAAADTDVRTYAALALGMLEDRRAVPALVRALDDADPNVRFHAIEALGRIGAREAADPLAAVAESRDFAVAFAALDALALVGEPSVAPRLVPLLEDDLLQVAAADALGRLGGEEAVGPLAMLLGRPGAPVPEVAGALAALHERLDAPREAAADAQGDGRPAAAGVATVAELARAVLADRVPDAAGILADALADPGLAPAHQRAIVIVLGWLPDAGVEHALARMLEVPATRRLAADVLGHRGARAVTPLLEALDASGGEDGAETRKAIATALGRVGASAGVPALVAMLDDEPEVAVVAAGALCHVGDARAFEPLLARLDHPQAAVRQGAIAALNSIGHPEMPGRVRALLGHASPRVREAAVRIAGYFADDETLDAVLGLRGDSDESVRRAAIEQLAHFEDPRAAAALADALGNEAPGVRAAAARALGHAPPERALPLLQRAAQDLDPWVRYYVARALGHVGEPAVPTLLLLASNDLVPPVRIAAIDALGAVATPAGITPLVPFAIDPDSAIAAPALMALGSGDDGTTMAPLVAALDATEKERRLTALAALGRRADASSAVRAIEGNARADEDADVRAAAVEVLARIGTREAVAALVALAEQPRRGAAVVEALAGMGEPQVEWIADGLEHPDVGVRCVVIEALVRMRGTRGTRGSGTSGVARAVARALARALDDPAQVVRQAAAHGLSRLDLQSGSDHQVRPTAPRAPGARAPGA